MKIDITKKKKDNEAVEDETSKDYKVYFIIKSLSQILSSFKKKNDLSTTSIAYLLVVHLIFLKKKEDVGLIW